MTENKIINYYKNGYYTIQMLIPQHCSSPLKYKTIIKANMNKNVF